MRTTPLARSHLAPRPCRRRTGRQRIPRLGRRCSQGTLPHPDLSRSTRDRVWPRPRAAAPSTSGEGNVRHIIFTAKAAQPPATYSQAVKAAGLVFVSGTAPVDPSTGAIDGTTIQEQTRRCLENIVAILGEAGSSLDKIVSATVVLADEDDFAGMNEE